jgi:hypothetical protein
MRARAAVRWCAEKNLNQASSRLRALETLEFRSSIEEYDTGSERTLAAWIRHASRTANQQQCWD